ncbi:unnamed protein product [Staurois parvus]|uniref:Uncharacterized protein n=1 Tax=Staurois parvus TaxID=386267 RepID=A0ABN9AXS0_9NEOB|nr:unnamed protein product [Staurois parvus]
MVMTPVHSTSPASPSDSANEVWGTLLPVVTDDCTLMYSKPMLLLLLQIHLHLDASVYCHHSQGRYCNGGSPEPILKHFASSLDFYICFKHGIPNKP